MFTGIIEAIGTIESISKGMAHKARSGDISARLAIRCKSISPSMAVGESLAIDGVCLTIEEIRGELCKVFVSQETVDRTTLGHKRRGDAVNLERPLGIGSRLGGHIVSGHVDGVGHMKSITPRGDTHIVDVVFPPALRHLIIPTGSICIDGISLTILEMNNDALSVCIIPYTWKTTTMQWKRSGDLVNLECDMLAKYLYAWARGSMAETAPELPLQKGMEITRQLLERTGFV